jgi:ribosomal protein L28
LRRAAAAIRADVDACQFTVVAPHNGRRSAHSAVHTSRRRDAR